MITFGTSENSYCVLHDLGKVHYEFQKMLQGNPHQWKHQRHELFSCLFIQSLNGKGVKLIISNCCRTS
jgi:CRISPR/Cas system-associated endonuclease Cas3-HD